MRCGKHVSDYENRKHFFCSLRDGHKGEHGEFPESHYQGVYPKSLRVRCLGWTVGAKDGCGRLSKVSGMTYIQTHWYTEPYSCTQGDYWNEGEGRFKCPKCGALNRLYERPLVKKLKDKFGRVEDTY